LDSGALIKDIMSKPPLTVRKDASVQEAAKVMFNNRVGSVLVVDEDGKLTGIVTERDLVYLVASGKLHLASEYPVWEIMTENPVTANPNETVEDALLRMKEINVRHLPVVDEDGKPVGVVSIRDILSYMIDYLKKIHA
jgi:CBS domain-containing protein